MHWENQTAKGNMETAVKRVLPSVQIWPDSSNTVIPGTLIPAGAFVDIKQAAEDTVARRRLALRFPRSPRAVSVDK